MPYRRGIEPCEFTYTRQTGGKHHFLRVTLQAAAADSGPPTVAVAGDLDLGLGLSANPLGTTEVVDALLEAMTAEASKWSSTPLRVTVTALDAYAENGDPTVVASVGGTDALRRALDRWNQPPEGGVREPRRPLPG